MRIIVETAGETTEQTDILQLVAADWRRIGIDLFIKPSQRDVLRRRVYSGRTMMSLWSGLDTGRPEPDMPPDELAPMAQDNLQWPAWGQYYQTNGTSGEPPDIPQAQELLSLALAWRSATAQQQRRIWEQMLELHAEQTFTIGIVSGVRQPVVVSNRLRNVPEEAHYGWNPGAQFGIYRPDQFWFDDKITILPPSDGTAANGI